MINFNNLKGFGGAPPQAPETLLGYDPYMDIYSPPNPDGGGGGGRLYPMPPIDLYFQPTAVPTRQENINNMYLTTDENGIIQNPNSVYDKRSFSDYVSQNRVTSEELAIAMDAKARAGGFYSQPSPQPSPPSPPPPFGYDPRYGGPKAGGGADGYDGSGILPDWLRPDRPDGIKTSPDSFGDFRTIDPLPSNDNNKLFFDCKQNEGVFVYTKESVSLYGTLQLQKKMQFYTDKGFLAKLKPAELGANISTPLGAKFVPFAKKMPNGRYKFIYSAENGIQTLIVSPKGVLVNIKSGGC